jgi:hypothetical protein
MSPITAGKHNSLASRIEVLAIQLGMGVMQQNGDGSLGGYI